MPQSFHSQMGGSLSLAGLINLPRIGQRYVKQMGLLPDLARVDKLTSEQFLIYLRGPLDAIGREKGFGRLIVSFATNKYYAETFS